MKIVDYSSKTFIKQQSPKADSFKEGLTAALLFLVPALLLFVLAK